MWKSVREFIRIIAGIKFLHTTDAVPSAQGAGTKLELGMFYKKKKNPS